MDLIYQQNNDRGRVKAKSGRERKRKFPHSLSMALKLLRRVSERENKPFTGRAAPILSRLCARIGGTLRPSTHDSGLQGRASRCICHTLERLCRSLKTSCALATQSFGLIAQLEANSYGSSRVITLVCLPSRKLIVGVRNANLSKQSTGNRFL